MRLRRNQSRLFGVTPLRGGAESSNEAHVTQIAIPKSLTISTIPSLVSQLGSLPVTDTFAVDFSNLSWTTPAGLCMAVAAFRQFRTRYPAAACRFEGYEKHEYQAFMGFFRCLGIDFGSDSNLLSAGDTYLPLKDFKLSAIKGTAKSMRRPVAELIDEHSVQLARILTKDGSSGLFVGIRYLLREIIRNSAEHSQADSLLYCAQLWPTKKRLEIAIVDSGIGVRASLAANPHLAIASDLDALELATLPGISGKAFAGAKIKRADPWQNSGYGLYIASRLGRESGRFFIGSRSAALSLTPAGEKLAAWGLEGTAIVLNIDISDIDCFEAKIARYADEGRALASTLHGANQAGASAASLKIT